MKTKSEFLKSILTCAMALSGVASGFGQQPPATIQFSSPAYNVAEDAGTALITVLRTGETNSVLTVDYAANDGTAKTGADYAAQSATLRFAAGETNKTFTISILDDGLVEGDELLNVVLNNPTGGATVGSQKTALLTMLWKPLVQTSEFQIRRADELSHAIRTVRPVAQSNCGPSTGGIMVPPYRRNFRSGSSTGCSPIPNLECRR
jgi:hypothetical protein